MKLFLTIAFIFAFTIQPLLAARDFAELTPPDASFFVQVRDFQKLKENFTKANIGKLWNDEKLKEFMKPMREAMGDSWKDYLKGMMLDPDEQKRMFDRQLVLFVGQLEPMGYGYTFEVCLIAQMTDATVEDYKKYIEKTLGEIPEKAKRTVLKAHGETVFRIKWTEEVTLYDNMQLTEEQLKTVPDEWRENMQIEQTSFERNIQYAFVDGVFVYCDGDDKTTIEVIRQLKNRSVPSLANTNAYTKSFKGHPQDSDIRFFWNLKRYGGFLKQQKKEIGEEPDPNFPNPFENLEGFGTSVAFPDSELKVKANLFCNDMNSGIGRLIKQFQNNPKRIPQVAPKDSFSVDSLGCNWSVLYEEFIQQYFPAQQVSQMFEMTIEQALGVKVKPDIIDQLGNEIGRFTFDIGDSVKPDFQEVSLIEIKDADRSRDTIKRMVKKFIPNAENVIQKSNFSGFTINQIERADSFDEAEAFCWVVTDRYLLLANKVEALRKTLRTILGTEANLTANLNFRKGLKVIPRDAVSWGWADLERIDSKLNAFLNSTSTIDLLMQADVGTVFDLDSLPKEKLISKYLKAFLVALQITKDGIELDMQLSSN